MLLLDEKSNPPAPSSVTYAPVGRSTDAIQTDAGSSEPQDTYDPELPPPAYESVKNAGNSIHQIAMLCGRLLIRMFFQV